MLFINYKIRRLCSLLLFIAIAGFIQPLVSFGQRYEFGAGAGLIHYRGDIQPSYFPKKPFFAAELVGRYNFSMTAVGRVNLLFAPSLSYSSAGSSDPTVRASEPSYGFSTFLGELSFLGEYNFFNYRNPKNRFVFGSPYLFGGPGLCMTQIADPDNFEPDSTFGKVGTPGGITPAKNRQAFRFFPLFILGVGYKQQLGQYFNLGIQASGRFLFTDKFDQVSDREKGTTRKINPDGSYAAITDESTQESRYVQTESLGKQLGNKFDRDSYFYIGLSLTYTIKEIICPFKYETKKEK